MPTHGVVVTLDTESSKTANPKAARRPLLRPWVGVAALALLFVWLYARQVTQSNLNYELYRVMNSCTAEDVERVLTAGADPNARHGEDEEMHPGLIERIRNLFRGRSQQGGSRPPLAVAVGDGKVAVAFALLNHGADPREASLRQPVLLYDAVRTQSFPLVKVLLERKCSLEGKGEYGDTPLMEAIDLGRRDITRSLLEHGANIHARSDYGFTVLMSACWSDDYVTVKKLIDSGVDWRVRADDGYTALHAACCSSDTRCLRMLLDLGAQVNDSGYPERTPLMEAAYKNNLPAVQLLLQRGADVRARGRPRGWTALHSAGWGARRDPKRAIEIMKVLIAAGADPKALTSYNESTAYIAAWSKEAEPIQFLLDAGSSTLPAKSRWADRLSDAAAKGKTDTCRLLMGLGVSCNLPDTLGQGPLISAVRGGHLDTIDFLISKGANVNYVDPRGYTVLMHAVLANNPMTVKLLLKAGADPSKTVQGVSAFQLSTPTARVALREFGVTR